MIDSLTSQRLLGEFRGEAAVDRDRTSSTCWSVSGGSPSTDPTCVSVDVNPLIVTADGTPVAVDALVELAEHRDGTRPSRPRAVDPSTLRTPTRSSGRCSSRGAW